MTKFSYIGRGLTLPQFAEYVSSYPFGNATHVVLHHTAIPDASWAKLKDGIWDANESGLTEQQIYDKRLRQLTGIKNYYEGKNTWDRGPHLFIDDKWIWLFSPMNTFGIHARTGNGNKDNYSIGIEVVGYYEKVKWPKVIENNVGAAIGYLQQRLETFQITHKVGPGGISSHRDWGKPECPGAAITERYYIQTIKRVAGALGELPTTSAPVDVAQRYICLGNGLRVRQQPNTTSVIVGSLRYGQIFDAVEVQGESILGDTRWGRLSNGGFVSLRYAGKR
jgi:hypothetical protein